MPQGVPRPCPLQRSDAQTHTPPPPQPPCRAAAYLSDPCEAHEQHVAADQHDAAIQSTPTAAAQHHAAVPPTTAATARPLAAAVHEPSLLFPEHEPELKPAHQPSGFAGTGSTAKFRELQPGQLPGTIQPPQQQQPAAGRQFYEADGTAAAAYGPPPPAATVLAKISYAHAFPASGENIFR